MARIEADAEVVADDAGASFMDIEAEVEIIDDSFFVEAEADIEMMGV